MNKFFSYALVAFLAIGLTACDSNNLDDLPAQNNTIVQVAQSSDFSTLAAAIDAADLRETLASDGPFTVFAPTDEAFAKLPENALRTLLAPENKDKLVAILTYHVVPGRVFAQDVLTISSAKSAQGGDLNFNVEGETVKVNNARVTAVDLEATNGVVHVIDTVLLPDWVGEWLERSAIQKDPLVQD